MAYGMGRGRGGVVVGVVDVGYVAVAVWALSYHTPLPVCCLLSLSVCESLFAVPVCMSVSVRPFVSVLVSKWSLVCSARSLLYYP